MRTALVVGAEAPTPFVDWDDRNTAVLFGDGAGSVVVQASAREEGLLAQSGLFTAEQADAAAVESRAGRPTTFIVEEMAERTRRRRA